MTSAYVDLMFILVDVREQCLLSHGPQREYWQGKKDGLRTAMAMIAPDDQQGIIESIQESALHRRQTRLQELEDTVKEAVRIFEMLDTGASRSRCAGDIRDFLEAAQRQQGGGR